MTTNPKALGGQPLAEPTINLNGTSAEVLVEQHRAVLDALQEALEALRHTAPNGRDYLQTPAPDAAEVFARAVEQHRDRLRSVQAVHDEVLALALGVRAQRWRTAGGVWR